MPYSEVEAETKLCPILSTRGTQADIPPVPATDLVFCVASGCMWWRWADKGKLLGYCGMAGPDTSSPT